MIAGDIVLSVSNMFNKSNAKYPIPESCVITLKTNDFHATRSVELLVET